MPALISRHTLEHCNQFVPQSVQASHLSLHVQISDEVIRMKRRINVGLEPATKGSLWFSLRVFWKLNTDVARDMGFVQPTHES